METLLSAGKLAGGIFGLSLFGVVVDESTHIPVGVAIGAACTVVVGAWWLSAKFTKIDDKFESLQNRIDRLSKD